MFYTIPIRNLWVIQKDGLCLIQDNFTQNPNGIDESIVGGFTAAIFNITSTLDTGIDSITIGGRVLNYFSENEIIVCVEVDKKDKVKSVKEAIEIIHKAFCGKYNDTLGIGNLLDTTLFAPFKKDYLEILNKCKLLPKHLTPEKKRSSSFRDRVSRTI